MKYRIKGILIRLIVLLWAINIFLMWPLSCTMAMPEERQHEVLFSLSIMFFLAPFIYGAIYWVITGE